MKVVLKMHRNQACLYCVVAVISALVMAGCMPRDDSPDVGKVPAETPSEAPEVGAAPDPAPIESPAPDVVVDDKKEEAPPPAPEKKQPDVVAKEETAYVPVDISAAFNATATGGDRGFDGWGNAYPAEKLPSGEKKFGASPVVFDLPDFTEAENNIVTAAGQPLKVPPGKYIALYLLAAATQGNQQAGLVLTYGDEEDVAALKITDWCRRPAFGEVQAGAWPRVSGENEDAECRLHMRRIALDPAKELSSITLPTSKLIHVFAMTLAK